MAHRKSAQKVPKKQPNCKSIVRASKFPAERIPSELIHAIFKYLEPTEAAAFRLVGRVVAEIGLQYLVSTVYLALNEESYDRLLAIAEHPIASKYVAKLGYETEGLRIVDLHQWGQMWRAYNQESVRDMTSLNRTQTTRAFNRAWSRYVGYHASQKRVQQAHFFPEKIAKAMKQLPNLRTIFATVDGAEERYVAEMKKLLPTYNLLRNHHIGRSSIADPTSSILSAAGSVDLRCQHFLSQSINLRIFGQIDNDSASLKNSMLHLKTLDLNVKLQREPEEDESVNIGTLKNGCVLDLVTSAPNLQHLSLAFTWIYGYPDISFNETIGGFHWPCLKAVSLVRICSHEHELRDFFGRHARTLKHVSLKDMHHYEGSWQKTFQEMRRKSAFGQQLNTCKLVGFFSSPTNPTIHIVDTVISDYVQDTDFEDISLNEYCGVKGVSLIEFI